jgi:hypothetical protein
MVEINKEIEKQNEEKNSENFFDTEHPQKYINIEKEKIL